MGMERAADSSSQNTRGIAGRRSGTAPLCGWILQKDCRSGNNGFLYQKNRRVMQLIDNTNTIPRGEMFFLEKFFYEDYNDKIKQQYLEKNLTFNKLTYKFKTKPSPDCVLSKIIMTDGTCFEYSKNESR